VGWDRGGDPRGIKRLGRGAGSATQLKPELLPAASRVAPSGILYLAMYAPVSPHPELDVYVTAHSLPSLSTGVAQSQSGFHVTAAAATVPIAIVVPA